MANSPKGCCWLNHGDAFKEVCDCYELERRRELRESLKKKGTDQDRQIDMFKGE